VVVADVTVELAEKLKEVSVTSGDLLRLCLSESPTTGYLWVHVGILPPALADLGNKFEPLANAIGSAGRRCFTYSCKGAFETELRFILRRPWSPNEVVDEVHVKLTCKPKKAG
jgi:predicted secreted protein